jgi:riboflavin biosynthesis pyrimidine reductase
VSAGRSWRERFDALCERKTRAAEEAALAPSVTLLDRASTFDLVSIGDAASRRMFDGPFYATRPRADLPAIHLVFVRSRAGNTGAGDPATLGGGATDQHLIYEGLSRVFVDAVVAGSSTVGPGTFFSIWRPELVRLRAALGLPRHPAQIVLSLACTMDPDRYVMFNVPEVPVYVLTNADGRGRLAPRVSDRPWVRIVDADGPDALAQQAMRLRAAGLRHLSAVGGRRAATALADAGLVRDLYLTTTAIDAGEADTPWYVGSAPPAMQEVVRKQWESDAGPVTFQHFTI